MSQFMKGIKQTVAKDKITHGKSLEEGGKPMNFSTYKLMCKNSSKVIMSMQILFTFISY